jgi:outer membrane protein OmpA-like peptidoglycan-associated protein
VGRDVSTTGLLQPRRAADRARRVDDAAAEHAASTSPGRGAPNALRTTPARHRLGLGAGRSLAELGIDAVSLLGRRDSPPPVDWSAVRVHDDAAAARLTSQHAAAAVAVGRDVAFAPGALAPATDAGQERLRHELGHVAQQAAAGGPAIQREGRRGTGIGRTPPREEFDRSPLPEGETAPEDDHVRFAHDSASVPESFLDQFRLLLNQHNGPVTVELHGYSSDDGDQEYNINLSAHRGVAVKRAIESMLPPGSVVRVIAHGVTAGFGEGPDPNRRVGIDLSDRYTLSEITGVPRPRSLLGVPELTIDARLLPPPVLPQATDQAPTDPSQTGQPGTAPPVIRVGGPPPWDRLGPTAVPGTGPNAPLFGPGSPPLLSPYGPNFGLLSGLDWPTMHTEARGRGVQLGSAETDLIARHYLFYYPLAAGLYRNFAPVRWFFSSEADVANTFTRQLIKNSLSRDFPTPLEAFDREWERQRQLLGLPPGVSTPVLGPTWKF